jgi:hypothetical protein
VVHYTELSLRANNVREPCILKFMELVNKTRFLIVFPEEQTASLWDKLNYAGKFDPLVSTFVDKLSQDALFSEYFA